jgi:uncharacterized protein with HEPN domain
MLDASQKAQEFMRDRTRAELDTDEMLSLAMVRLIEIVGEAASRISDQIKQSNPQIPWTQIAGTRNRLIHGYFNVDLDIIWSIVQDDLPSLIEHLERILSQPD